ncbi:MAG TPA: hypothetical protein VIK78_21905 [Ruminiclostridium sp.]
MELVAKSRTSKAMQALMELKAKTARVIRNNLEIDIPIEEVVVGGFSIERSMNGGAFSVIAAPGQNANTGSMIYTDTTAAPGNAYDYRVKALNGTIIASTYSNIANVVIPSLSAIPAAPTGLSAVLQSAANVSLTWTDNATNEAGFTLQRSLNGGAFINIATPKANNNTGSANYLDTTVAAGNTYAYR